MLKLRKKTKNMLNRHLNEDGEQQPAQQNNGQQQNNNQAQTPQNNNQQNNGQQQQQPAQQNNGQQQEDQQKPDYQKAWQDYCTQTFKSIDGLLQQSTQSVPTLKENQEVQNAYKAFTTAVSQNNAEGVCDALKQFFTTAQQAITPQQQEDQQQQNNNQQNNNQQNNGQQQQQPAQQNNGQQQNNNQAQTPQNESFAETFSQVLYEDRFFSTWT